MATVTALRRVPGRLRPGAAPGGGAAAGPSTRVAVEVDGEPWLVLEEGDVLRLGLCTGLAVDDGLHERATAAAATATATRRAGRLLARRPLASADLEARLAPAAGAAAARDVVGRLEAVGIVDDRTFAAQLAEERLRRGFGPAAIEALLLQRGVGEALAAEVAATLDPGAVLRAARVAAAGRTGAAGWRRLGSRGFDEDVAEAVLGAAADDGGWEAEGYESDEGDVGDGTGSSA
jgi:regulatory protein